MKDAPTAKDLKPWYARSVNVVPQNAIMLSAFLKDLYILVVGTSNTVEQLNTMRGVYPGPV